MDLKKIPVVRHHLNDIFDVVRFVGMFRQNEVQSVIRPINGISVFNNGGRLGIVLRKKREKLF